MNDSLAKSMSMTDSIGLKPYITPTTKFCKVLKNHSINDFDNSKVCQSVPKKQFPYQAMTKELER